jgi:hypothetical protein
MSKTRSVSAVMERAADVGGKRRWKASDARAALGAQAASGLSLAAFARREGRSPTRLMWWRKQRRGRSRTTPSALVRLLPVSIRRSEPASLPGSHVEIAVRGGRVIRVGGPFDPQAVAQLVRALEELAC